MGDNEQASMAFDDHHERRVLPRIGMRRPVKVFHEPTSRFLPAHTINVSDGGLLLEIDTPRPLRVGEALRVVVAWDRPGVARLEDMERCEIVRREPLNRVAVRLTKPELDFIADALVTAAEDVKGATLAYGT